VDCPAMLAALEESGYTCYVSCEYRSSTTTSDSSGWLTAFQAGCFPSELGANEGRRKVRREELR
jgi:hypothetical protein